MPANLPALFKGRPWQEWVSLACRLGLGLFMLWMVKDKLFALEDSVGTVRAYQLLPFEWTAPVGYAVPVIELIIAVLLLAGLLTRATALVEMLLMLMFVGVIASLWMRGIALDDCGCSGGTPQQIAEIDVGLYVTDIVRDLVAAAAAAWLVWKPKTPFSLDGWLFAEPDFDDDLLDDDDGAEPSDDPAAADAATTEPKETP